MVHIFDDLTISREQLNERLKDLGCRSWAREYMDSIWYIVDDLPDSFSSDELEDRIESIFDLIGESAYKVWPQIASILCPELYNDPACSNKRSTSLPGTKSRIWRMRERASAGKALFQKSEQDLIFSAKQTTLF